MIDFFMPVLAAGFVIGGFFIGWHLMGMYLERRTPENERKARKAEKARNKYYRRAAHSEPGVAALWEDAAAAAQREADYWRNQ